MTSLVSFSLASVPSVRRPSRQGSVLPLLPQNGGLAHWHIFSSVFIETLFRFFSSVVPLLRSREFPSVKPGGVSRRQLFPLYKVLRHKRGLLCVLCSKWAATWRVFVSCTLSSVVHNLSPSPRPRPYSPAKSKLYKSFLSSS